MLLVELAAIEPPEVAPVADVFAPIGLVTLMGIPL